MELGNKLRKQRVLKGLTQKEVADKIGMTHSAYAKYERGERKITIEFLKKLHKNFGFTLSLYNDIVASVQANLYAEIEDFVIKIEEDEVTQLDKKEMLEVLRELYKEVEDIKHKIVELIKPISFSDLLKKYDLEYLMKADKIE